MRTGTRRGPERCTRAGSNHSRCKPTSTSWPCVATWSAIPCGPTWSSKQKPGAGEVYGIGCTARRTGSWPPGRWRSLRFGWSTSMRRNRNRNWLVAALCDARQSVWRRRLAYGHGGDTGVAVHAPTARSSAHSAVALKKTPDPFFSSSTSYTGGGGPTINSSTGVVSWGAPVAGTYTFTVTVSDSFTPAAKAYQTYTLTVRGDSAPTITTWSPPTSVVMGTTYRYDVKASDVDNTPQTPDP